jgi:hypothetical protein
MQQVNILRALQACLDYVEHIKADLPQMGDDIRIKVFICQQRKVAELQSPTSALTRTSLRTAAAA